MFLNLLAKSERSRIEFLPDVSRIGMDKIRYLSHKPSRRWSGALNMFRICSRSQRPSTAHCVDCFFCKWCCFYGATKDKSKVFCRGNRWVQFESTPWTILRVTFYNHKTQNSWISSVCFINLHTGSKSEEVFPIHIAVSALWICFVFVPCRNTRTHYDRYWSLSEIVLPKRSGVFFLFSFFLLAQQNATSLCLRMHR